MKIVKASVYSYITCIYIIQFTAGDTLKQMKIVQVTATVVVRF